MFTHSDVDSQDDAYRKPQFETKDDLEEDRVAIVVVQGHKGGGSKVGEGQ